MEPEFDKVIDALLRSSPKVGGNGGASPVHLDAADIAAFAENALPAPIRAEFTTHFADCGRCRGVLANAIAMNAEAEPEAAVAATAAAPVRAAETAEPWYRRLFRAPNLAFAMGALVLVFGGLIGYTVLQNSAGGEATIAQVEDEPTAASGPMAPDDSYFSANTASNAANAAANSNAMTRAANTASIAPTPETSGGGGGRLNTAERAEGYSLEVERDVARSQPSAAAPPPPPLTAAKTEEPKDDKEAKVSVADSQVAAEQQRQVQAMPPIANSGPVQSTATRKDNAALAKKRSTVPGAAPIPVREVGGKTFERREGVWYDRAYSGQPTTNVRRGTDDYRKLDSGLRSITDNINGTVVVVWKEKAYRVQ